MTTCSILFFQEIRLLFCSMLLPKGRINTSFTALNTAASRKHRSNFIFRDKLLHGWSFRHVRLIFKARCVQLF